MSSKKEKNISFFFFFNFEHHYKTVYKNTKIICFSSVKHLSNVLLSLLTEMFRKRREKLMKLKCYFLRISMTTYFCGSLSVCMVQYYCMTSFCCWSFVSLTVYSKNLSIAHNYML